jgi:hypothetical protein
VAIRVEAVEVVVIDDMRSYLPLLELIGSFLVLGQCVMTVVSVRRLYIDKNVAGMSIGTMAFYAFASWFYVPVFWLSDLFWTMIAVALLGAIETWWCILALYYKRRKPDDCDDGDILGI